MNGIVMRKPCRSCGTTEGYIETKSGQDCVYCQQCKRHQYNAPRVETGRAVRTVTTIHNGIKPGQRARVLDRDNARCVLCGADGENKTLHVGHLLSVSEGMKQGLTEVQLNDDENLATMCDECNLGMADRPVSMRFLMAVLAARLKFTKGEVRS